MIPFPKKRYAIIYADPPWRYGCWYKSKKVKRNAADHYRTTATSTLKEYKIPAADNSVCFLWVTYPCLKEGMELLEAWGFTYKTVAFTWVKKNKKADTYFFGLGNYTRANAEIVLLGTKGRGLKRISKSVRQICDAKIREHSQKPDEICDRIVSLFGDLPRIILFSRTQVPGWDVWGDEVN